MHAARPTALRNRDQAAIYLPVLYFSCTAITHLFPYISFTNHHTISTFTFQLPAQKYNTTTNRTQQNAPPTWEVNKITPSKQENSFIPEEYCNLTQCPMSHLLRTFFEFSGGSIRAQSSNSPLNLQTLKPRSVTQKTHLPSTDIETFLIQMFALSYTFFSQHVSSGGSVQYDLLLVSNAPLENAESK